MNQRTFKRTRKKLRKLFDEWIVRLGLKWWDVKIRYYKKTPKRFKKKSGYRTAADTWADWRYMVADVYVSVSAASKMSDAALEKLVIHELCHVLVNEMRSKGIDHEERVTTRLEQAFRWTKEGI